MVYKDNSISTPVDSTIPKQELESLTIGSTLSGSHLRIGHMIMFC